MKDDLAHPIAVNPIECVWYWEPAHSHASLTLIWTNHSSFCSEQIVGHHFAAASPTFDDLIAYLSNCILDYAGEPGLLEHYNGPGNLDNDRSRDRVDYQNENHLHIRLRCAAYGGPIAARGSID